MEIGQEGKE